MTTTSASCWCMEGRKEPDSREAYPSVGSIASKFRGPRQPGMPAYVMLAEEPVMHHHLFDAMGPGYLGVSHSPFAVLQNPYPFEFQSDRCASATSSLEIANDATLDRINDRKSLLAVLDQLPRRLDSNRVQEGLDPFAKLALELITSEKARRAFDLNAESAATREPLRIAPLGADGTAGSATGRIGRHLCNAQHRSRLPALGLARQHHS